MTQQIAAPKKSFLSQVKTGTIESPPKILVFGGPGVGKSTLACSAPGVIVLQGEEGTNNINTDRFPKPESWADVRDSVQSLIDEPHNYSTLVVDTLDGLEEVIFADVCTDAKVNSIEKAFGGYGKGYNRARDYWRELRAQFERLMVKRGMSIVLVAHSTLKTFNNPEGADYDRYIPRMNEKAWGDFYQWCDAVLFAQYEQHSLGSDPNEKAKAIATGARFLRTSKKVAWEAKNRYGFPESIPMQLERGWSAVSDYIAAPKKLRTEIEALLVKAPPELATPVRAWLSQVGENATELALGLERLKTRLAPPADAKPITVTNN